MARTTLAMFVVNRRSRAMYEVYIAPGRGAVAELGRRIDEGCREFGGLPARDYPARRPHSRCETVSIEHVCDNVGHVERVVKHWWNGLWGRIARRDVYVITDGGRRWMVEAREGGADGRVKRRHECHDEREALALAQRWCGLGDDDWRYSHTVIMVPRQRQVPPAEQVAAAVAEVGDGPPEPLGATASNRHERRPRAAKHTPTNRAVEPNVERNGAF